MPKVSKATASSHLVFPGYTDQYGQEIGDWAVSIESNFTDMDYAPFFKGAPNDQCQASHVGYVLKGKFGALDPSMWPSPPSRRRGSKPR